MQNMSCHKIYPLIVVGIAVILGLLAVTLSPYMLDDIFTPLIRLFEIMIAVLVIGSLIKYLLCSGSACACACHEGKVCTNK